MDDEILTPCPSCHGRVTLKWPLSHNSNVGSATTLRSGGARRRAVTIESYYDVKKWLTRLQRVSVEDI